ncbi:MAG: hypothetical protein RSA95_03780, partial [Citrobacter sp.]|uniref:hypothetical protein n=1 Tax=Citrobacter sp. TaxID=1896336 RepID=UPI002FCB1D75
KVDFSEKEIVQATSAVGTEQTESKQGYKFRCERTAEVHNSFRQSSREVMIKINSHKGSGHDIV